jgi:DNA-directed RNA polymerase specialized sigma24 family protein
LTEKPDPHGEWVLLRSKQHQGEDPEQIDGELLAAARQAWPCVLAHVRRELGIRRLDIDETALAADVWEGVLRSVWRTRQRRTDHRPPIADLESYLIGAFHHRFNRFLKREQRRIETIELVSSSVELEGYESARDDGWALEIERAITVKQIISHMDEWTRKVWSARQYGYSWKEIAGWSGTSEQRAKKRFEYGLEKTRERVVEVSRKVRAKAAGQS